MTSFSWLLIYAHLAKSFEAIFILTGMAVVMWGVILFIVGCAYDSANVSYKHPSAEEIKENEKNATKYWYASMWKIPIALLLFTVAIFTPSSSTVLKIGGVEAVATILDSKAGKEISDDTVELARKYLKTQLKALEEKK